MKEIHHQKSSHLLNYSFIITINYSDETNLTTEQKFRIYSEKDYYQFYRLLAEKRAFYSLPMIDQTIVPSRFNSNFSFLNDLMQTISTPSLLNIATSKSSTIVNKKSYVFDVDKTLKQFYDDIRRYIYHFNKHFDNVMLKNYQNAVLVQDSIIHHHHYYPNQQEHYDNSVCVFKIYIDFNIGKYTKLEIIHFFSYLFFMYIFIGNNG